MHTHLQLILHIVLHALLSSNDLHLSLDISLRDLLEDSNQVGRCEWKVEPSKSSSNI